MIRFTVLKKRNPPSLLLPLPLGKVEAAEAEADSLTRGNETLRVQVEARVKEAVGLERRLSALDEVPWYDV